VTFIPTGDGVSGPDQILRFVVPQDQWPIATILGALDILRYASSWEQVGTLTPALAAFELGAILDSFMIQPSMVAQVVAFAADNMQYINQDPTQGNSQWRKCEGQFLSTALYPDLYARIGYTFGRSGSDFALPDLRGRVVIDAGNGSGLSPRALADTGGEETHTLSVAELASHTHPEGTTTPLLITAPPVGPVPVGVPSAGTTGSTGSDTPHNNMQPFEALIYYIQVIP
jgi:microcystin-dependent protein